MRATLAFLVAVPLFAQDSLSLHEAVGLALRGNKAIAGTTASLQASEARTAVARSRMLPRIDYSESFARSDNPVFVFSSLLTQHQFGLENFAIGPLNRPDPLNNFQSLVTVEQPIYDAGQTRRAIRSAELGRQMSCEEQRLVRMEVISQAARAYYGAVLAMESLKAAEQAVRSAEADLKRAEAIRAAGMSTDVDVLSIRVHLAAVTEQRIDWAANVEVGTASLNDALGLPMDTRHRLTTALVELVLTDPALDVLESAASIGQPVVRETRLATSLAKIRADEVHSAMLPQLSFRGAFETDRQHFFDRGGANWLASVSLRWNLFNGSADRARTVEAGHLVKRAESEEQRADSTIRLQVRKAYAALKAAKERIVVARTAVLQAEESLRITQNRYEAGMNNVTDLLRTETAVFESRTRYLAAVHDQRIAAALLELAAGRLDADSEVLN
jgi:outer membrane protein TolC